MAFIALILSLFVAVAPVAASPAFEAIDIELAHTIPNIPNIFVRDYQTAPQLRKMRTGEWSICGGVHSGLFAAACGWWPSGSSPNYLFGAVVAITAIAASFVCPTEGMEGIAMCNVGLFFTFFPEGQDESMRVVTTRGRVVEYCKRTGIVGKAETKALANNTFDFIMKSLDRQDVCTAEITTKLDRKAVQAAFPKALVLQGKRNNFVVIFGMSVEEYCDLLDTQITNKLGLKYQMGLFARVTGAGHSTPKVSIVDLPTGGDGDGILRYSSTEQLLELGVTLGDDVTNVRAKIWHSTMGLVKGLFVLVHDTSVDHLVVETNLEHNQKGCLQGPSLGLGVDCIVHAWTQSARPKAKAANTSPMMLAQLGNASYDACVPAAEASLEEDANRMVDAILHGTMDEAMFEGVSGDVNNQIIARDELRSLLNQAELPVASFGSLLRYLKPLIENWKGDLSTLKKACEKRAVAFRMPHSSISVVLSEGTFRRYCELTKPGEFVSFADRGITSMYSESIRMTVVSETYYNRVVENKFWDIGDNDGDTHVNAAIEVDGVETGLVHRWPAGAGDFDMLEPKCVDVPMHNKTARRLDGSIVELEPLKFNGETDCIELIDIDVHEDEHLPHGKLDANNFEAWQDTLEKNVNAAFKIGTYALLQTSLMSHDKKAVLPRCEFVVDGDIQGTSCVATSKEVDNAMKPAMTAFSEGDMVDSAMFAWARMGLNNYTLDPREAKKKVLLRGVEGSFSRLAKAMVAKRNECAKWLRDRYAEILRGGQRNSAPIIAAAEAAGLVADLEKGQRGVAYVNAGNSLALLRRLDQMNPRAAAEAVYSMYLYIDGQKGMFDSALFHCPESFPGTKYQTVAAYLVAYLIDGEGPNPEGDGPAPTPTETQETETETTEVAETTEVVETETMDESTQFEVLSSMKMDELKQVCRDAGLKGWSKLKKADLIRFIIDNTDDDDDDDNPTPPNGGGDNPKKGDNMSQEEDWSVVEQIRREAREKAEKLSTEQLKAFIKQREEDLSETWFNTVMSYSSKEELVQAVIEGCLHVWDTEDIPAPPNGGGDRGHETAGEAASRILEAMMPQIEAERAELAAQKEEEAKMAKKKTALVAEWVENGKAVQLKRNNEGIYFFVVDHGMRWIPKSVLSEEDSKDIEKVRSVYGQGKKMMAQGVASTLFKSLGLAALLCAALLGHEEGVAMYDMASVCFLTQEWDKIFSRVLRSMKNLRGAEMDYDRSIACGCPEEMIEDKAGMIALYQSEIDKGFESLEEIEYAMDNKELAEIRGSEYQSKQVKAKWPTRCGTQKGHWIATHPECRPGRCNRSHEPVIGKKAPLRVWWK